MARKTLVLAVLTGFVAAVGSAQTADELVEKNIKAQGGRKVINSVRSIRMTGKFLRGKDDEPPVVMEWVLPSHKMRVDFFEHGKTDTRVYDGSGGWKVMPSKNKPYPERLSGDELKDVKEDADFKGKLFDYKDKGSEVEYLGEDELGETPVYKLKLTKHDGQAVTIYLDAGSFLELQEEETRTVRCEATDWETRFADYKTIEGLTLPLTIKVRSTLVMGGGHNRIEGSAIYSFEKIEVNVDIPASRFDMPRVEPKKKRAPKDTAPPNP